MPLLSDEDVGIGKELSDADVGLSDAEEKPVSVPMEQVLAPKKPSYFVAAPVPERTGDPLRNVETLVRGGYLGSLFESPMPVNLVREPKTLAEGLYNTLAKGGSAMISPGAAAAAAAGPISAVRAPMTAAFGLQGAAGATGLIRETIKEPPKTVGGWVERAGDIGQQGLMMLPAAVHVFRPAIKLVGGGLVEGKLGQTHNEVIADKGLTTKDIQERGFVDENGKWNNREQTAVQVPGIKTETEPATATEPAKAHAAEVAEAQKTPPAAPTGEAPPSTTVPMGKQAEGVTAPPAPSALISEPTTKAVAAQGGEKTPPEPAESAPTGNAPVPAEQRMTPEQRRNLKTDEPRAYSSSAAFPIQYSIENYIPEIPVIDAVDAFHRLGIGTKGSAGYWDSGTRLKAHSLIEFEKGKIPDSVLGKIKTALEGAGVINVAVRDGRIEFDYKFVKPEIPPGKPQVQVPNWYKTRQAGSQAIEAWKKVVTVLDQNLGPETPPPPQPAQAAPAATSPEISRGSEVKTTGAEGGLVPPAEPGETGQLGGGAAEAGEIPETGAGGEKYGVAQRVREERAKAGQVAPVEPGQGISAAESVEHGRELLRAGADADKALSNFEATGKLSSDDMALVRAKGESLAAGARTIEDNFGTDSPEYKAAKKALSDWDKRSKAMQTEWHKTGMAQQGETDIDTGSFTGLERAHRDATGNDFTPEQAPTARKIAKRVRKVLDTSTEAMSRLLHEIENSGPAMSVAERRAFDAANKTVRENAARLAKAENDARTAAQALKTEEQRVQESARQKAASAKTERAGEAAIKAAQAENQGRIDKAKRSVATSQVQLKAAQRAKAAADKTAVDAAARLAEAERKSQADPIKRTWDRVKEYIEKGVDNFDEIRSKVATDLGMTTDQVARNMAYSQRVKYLADDMWKKQQAARMLQSQAKRWLLGLDTPAYEKWLATIPKSMFSLKVGFHGTVALGTHAPMLAFQPRFWEAYARNFGKMYKMVGSRAYYERQVQDLLRRPNYTVARRAGLINDPFVFEDFNSPDTMKFFAKQTGMGNRGYTVLKILRQDMFDQMWNKLPKTSQIPEVAEAIADGLNHATGVVKGKAPKGSAVLLFAPRLEASRAAWLVVDPIRSAMTFANWRNAGPGERMFAVNQVKEKAWVAGTFLSVLALNQGFLSAIGSKQTVNVTDPFKSDFMKFKVGGMDVAYGNAMITMARMAPELIYLAVRPGGKLKNLIYPDEDVATTVFKFIRSQLSPFAGTSTDLLFGSDYSRRPLPHGNRPMPKRLREQGVKPYTWPEYIIQTAAFIPLQEAIKEVWGQGLGMSDEQMRHYSKGLATIIFMGGTGARVTEDYDIKPNAPPQYYIPPEK